MSSINSGPAQTQSQNVQPVMGPAGTSYDPSNVAITGGAIGSALVAPSPSGLDDTTVLQGLHDALPAVGGSIYLQAGTYLIPSGGLRFSKQVRLIGMGARTTGAAAITTISCSSATADAIIVSAHGCVFTDFALVNSSGTVPTAGNGIKFSAGNLSRLSRLTVLGFWTNVRYDQGYYYSVTDCHLGDAVLYNLHLRNAAAGEGDHGDQIIHGNVFAAITTTRVPTACVYWESGGGLKFVGNKINGGTIPAMGSNTAIGTGLMAEVADGVSTSVFVITGNSIEAWNNAGIDIKQQAAGTGTGSIGKIVITGNEIAGNNGTGIAIHPAVATTFREVVIDGNSIGNCSTGVLLGNLDTAAIGVNTYRAVSGTILNLAGGVTNLSMIPQTVNGDGLVLYNDTGMTTADSGPFALSSLDLQRETGNITSNATPTVMYRIGVPTFGGGRIRFLTSGNLSGVGSYLYAADITYTREGAGVTAVVGTPFTAGGAITVVVDTTTFTNEVRIGIQRSGATGTAIQGRVKCVIEGNFGSIKKGA